MPYILKTGLLFVYLSLPAMAETTTELDYDDHRLINITTLNFNVCVQQAALEQINNHPDVRQIAGHAVELCDSKLDEIRAQLGSKMHPESYTGLERHIKNRAIKKLLVQLMYQKSSQADPATGVKQESVEDKQ